MQQLEGHSPTSGLICIKVLYRASLILDSRLLIRMESRLTDYDYLVGETQSLADIAWMPQYVLLDMLGFDFTPYPHTVVWAKRQQSRPSYNPAIGVWLPKVPAWVIRAGSKVRHHFRRSRAA